jgi:hypothetical protein
MPYQVEVHDGPVQAQTFGIGKETRSLGLRFSNDGRVNAHFDIVGIDHRQVAKDCPGFYVARHTAVAHKQQEDIPRKQIVNN